MPSTKALAGGNTYLTGMSVAMVPGNSFVGERVLQPVSVDYDEFSYVDFDRDDFIGATASGSQARGDRKADGTFERIAAGMSNSTDFCQERGFEAIIDRRKAAESKKKAIDLMRVGQMQTRSQLLLNREIQAAAALFNATTFASYTSALTGGDRWDTDTSSPIANRNTAIQSIQKSATAGGGDVIFGLLVGQEVHDALTKNPNVTDLVKHVRGLNSGPLPTYPEIAAYFNVDEYTVGGATYNSAVQTAAGGITGAYVWGKYALFYARARTPMQFSPSLGYTFTSLPFTVDTYYSPDSDGDVVRSRDAKLHKIVNAAAGYLFSTVIT